MLLAQILDQILDAMNEDMDDLPWFKNYKMKPFYYFIGFSKRHDYTIKS